MLNWIRPSINVTLNGKHAREQGVVICSAYMMIAALHTRLSSLATSVQLVDIAFIPYSRAGLLFNLFADNKRVLIFTTPIGGVLPSIASLYASANWLEREAAEMSGIAFSQKNDTRNLLLMFGDNSQPGLKAFPSAGLREIQYSATVDTLHWRPLSYQL